MSVRILFFAGARDAVGAAELDVPLGAPVSARDFLAQLCAAHPRLAPYSAALRLAVNGAYAAWDDKIADGDEVAVIPPVAGG